MSDPIDIGEARRRRDERLEMIGKIADFATTLPWLQDVREHPDFAIRFPAATIDDLEAAAREMLTRLATVQAPEEASRLPGRRDRCAAAAAWLRMRPHIASPLIDEGFREAFGDLTRAELVLTTVMLQGGQ